MTEHHHPAFPHEGPKVPSWMVTADVLRRWGFPVQGEAIFHEGSVKGEKFAVAFSRACRAGLVAQVSRPEAVAAARLAAWRSSLKVDPEVVAWFESIRRPVEAA